MYLLSNGAQFMGRASESSRRVAKETDGASVRAVAQERGFICEVMRILYTPYALSGRDWPLL